MSAAYAALGINKLTLRIGNYFTTLVDKIAENGGVLRLETDVPAFTDTVVCNRAARYSTLAVMVSIGAAGVCVGTWQKPCAGTSKAELNFDDKFWKAINPVSSTMASWSKCVLTAPPSHR